MKHYPVKTPHQIGAVLRGYRKEQGLTQGGVAEKVGIAQKAVSKIELSSERVALSTIFKLLAALDLELVIRPRKYSDKDADW